uniref:Uncharacterized protein n=1 Tax=Anguilla anguilla TaxID=7936 RepID=A0A0E9U091_ANGAN
MEKLNKCHRLTPFIPLKNSYFAVCCLYPVSYRFRLYYVLFCLCSHVHREKVK